MACGPGSVSAGPASCFRPPDGMRARWVSPPSPRLLLVIAPRLLLLPRLVVELQPLSDHGELDERAAVVVVGREGHGVAAHVEGLHRVERLREGFAGRLRADALQGLDHDLGADVRLERGERVML